MASHERTTNPHEHSGRAELHEQMSSMMERLRVDKQQLAEMLGLPLKLLSQDPLQEEARDRLRKIVHIFGYIEPWAGSAKQALDWYRSTPIPGFGQRTAEELVKSGYADAVTNNLERIAIGGYA